MARGDDLASPPALRIGQQRRGGDTQKTRGNASAASSDSAMHGGDIRSSLPSTSIQGYVDGSSGARRIQWSSVAEVGLGRLGAARAIARRL